MKKIKTSVKKFIIRKEEGSEFVEASFCIFATVLVLIILGFEYAVWQTQLNLNDKIDLVQTAYMKRIESVGYLSDTDKTNLTNELKEAGFSTVDLTGSTIISQEYGKPIQICISGEVDLADIDSFHVILPVIQYFRDTLGFHDFGKLNYVNHTFYGTSKN